MVQGLRFRVFLGFRVYYLGLVVGPIRIRVRHSSKNETQNEDNIPITHMTPTGSQFPVHLAFDFPFESP